MAGAGSQGQCQLDSSLASAKITVLVEDDDGGWDTGSVVVSQAVTLCADRYTGGLTGLLANGGCPPTSSLLVLPAVEAQTLCINRYTAALSWAPRGNCAPTTQLHLLPEDGPLPYCQNRYTGALRYTLTGACTSVERPGVIPGL